MDDQWRVFYMTLRKTLLEQVDAIERLLEIQRTAEIRAEYHELIKSVNGLQKEKENMVK